MTRRNPPAKWVLPQVVHPTEYLYFCVPVPNETFYLGAFRGALMNLASATQWQDDPAHTAREVALVWKSIINNLDDCTPEPGKIIYIDTSEVEMPICTQLRWNNGVLEGLCCFDESTGEMTWVPIPTDGTAPIPGEGGQPGSGSRPSAGQSKCYVVTLQASNQWLLPFNVADGDTITISDVSGAWSDGTIHWYCPDGTPFIFGACAGAAGHTGGDLDATAYHMQLIAQVGSVYYPASGGSFTLPGGTGNQQLILMANDGDRADNSGTITLKICVENGATPPVGEWCYIFDFSLSDYGWMPYVSSGTDRAVYTPGQGFEPGDDPYEALVQIQSPAFDATDLTSVEVVLSQVLTGAAHQVCVNLPDHTGTDHCITDDTITDFVIPITPVFTATGIFINVADDNSESAPAWNGFIRQVIVRGTGTNPFGASNC